MSEKMVWDGERIHIAGVAEDLEVYRHSDGEIVIYDRQLNRHVGGLRATAGLVDLDGLKAALNNLGRKLRWVSSAAEPFEPNDSVQS